MIRTLYILFQESPFKAEENLVLDRINSRWRIRGATHYWTIICLFLLIAIYIYFERWFAIRAANKIDKNFMDQIKLYVGQGKIEAAQALCIKEDLPLRADCKRNFSYWSPLEDINTTIENAGRLEVYKLEKNVSVSRTIAGAAPMIGFLGTVIGMILSIFEISNAGGNIDMKLLSDGLYTAMTTTVAGLIVGIVAYITYNHLVVKTNKVVYQMEATSFDFLDLIERTSCINEFTRTQ